MNKALVDINRSLHTLTVPLSVAIHNIWIVMISGTVDNIKLVLTFLASHNIVMTTLFYFPAIVLAVFLMFISHNFV